MAQYLLFTDGHHDHLGSTVLAEFGCSDLARRVEPATAIIGDKGGPSGHAGLLILPQMCGDERDPGLFYRPELQTWQRIAIGDERALWIGWETANPPKPSDLLRESVIAGPDITLRDGHEWMVPFCFSERSYYTIGDNGEPVRKKEPQHPRLYDLVAPSYERLQLHYHSQLNGDDEDSPWNNDVEFSVAVKLLAENYRLSVPVALALGLLTVNDVPKIIAHATRFALFAELQQAVTAQAIGGDSDGR
jgi:hypothetical protein